MASEVALVDTAMRADTTTLSEAARHATSLRQGDVLIDRYEIGDTLGIGGMGVVFEAFDRIAQEKIAVKILRGDVGLSGQLQTRFLAEAKISRTLSHENIVRVYDVGATEHFYYLTMERLWGQSLRARIEELSAAGQSFSHSEFHSILSQLIEALRFANRTLVHRDVKPENIWITREGVIKLMDFGIARVVDSNNTYTQATIGTPRYMSPEQRDSPKNVDWRTDQYALGVVLHEILTGRRPEIGMQSPAMLRKDISRDLSDAIVKAMAPEPDARHATWQAFKEAFEQNTSPPRSPWKVGAAGVLMTAIIGAAYLVFEYGVVESGDGSITTPAEQRNDAAKQAELERQQRAAEAARQNAAAEAARKNAAAESQARLAREQQAAEAAQRREAETRAREADAARLLERETAKKRQAAEAQRRLLNEQRAEAERKAEAARRAEAERLAELERQAQLERERQAAQALAPPPAENTTDDKGKKEKKNKRTLEGGFLPPSF